MKEELDYPVRVVRLHEQESGFRVSVLVPCKNPNLVYLRQCLQSIKDQWYEPFEVIVLDNNSSLDVKKDVMSLCKFFGFEYRREERDGIGFARKKLVEYSKGDYVAFLSCDDLWTEQFLYRMVEEAKNNKDCVVYCSYKIINNDSLITSSYTVRIYADFLDFCVACLEQAHDNTMFVCFDCVLIPKNVFKIYNFNEELKQSEDLDFLINTMYYVPYVGIKDHLVKYRIHFNSTTSRTSQSIARINKVILNDFYRKLNDFREEMVL